MQRAPAGARRRSHAAIATALAGATVFELLISGTLGLLELGAGRPDRAIAPLERARALAARTGLREAGHFHHLGHVYQKLSIASRAVLGTALSGSRSR